MNISRILALNIPDIHPAYGGVRGKTMSSRSQGYAWPVIKDAGVHTIIDLRNDDMNQRMQNLCEEYGMEYFYFLMERDGKGPMPIEEFKRRKQVINEQNKRNNKK